MIRAEKTPDFGILLNNSEDDFFEGYQQSKEAFSAIIKDNTFQLYLSDRDFRFRNEGIQIGCNL